MKKFILSAMSVLSVLVFITSLCAIGSSWLAAITLFASEAWIVLYILREQKTQRGESDD